LGQAVTFADLEGTAVDITFINDRISLRDGQEISVRMEQNVKLVLGPGGTIHSTAVNTAHSPRGVRQGQPRTGTSKLSQPRQLQNLGGGHGVWVFIDGTLTFLRTYKGGAYRQSIAFARNSNGFSCTARAAFMRENGVGKIVLDSAVGDGEVTILNDKPVSSSCRVTK
jgi:hypothetical protein